MLPLQGLTLLPSVKSQVSDKLQWVRELLWVLVTVFSMEVVLSVLLVWNRISGYAEKMGKKMTRGGKFVGVGPKRWVLVRQRLSNGTNLTGQL